MNFEYIEHTADLGIRAYGVDYEDLFINAAKGLFTLITDINSVTPAKSKEISINADNIEELLVDWLNELIYIFETEHILFSEFTIITLTINNLNAIAKGETMNSKHIIKRQIKAATYHMLKIEKHNSIFSVDIIFDI